MKNLKAGLLTIFALSAVAGLLWLAAEYTIVAGYVVLAIIAYLVFHIIKQNLK